MNFEKATLERLLREACENIGHREVVELPTGVAAEFARLLSKEQESALRTAAVVLAPALQMLIAMKALGGPSNVAADVERGYALLSQAI